MNRHRAVATFWKNYTTLPAEIKAAADKQFAFLKANPRHPSLQLKQVGRFWSVRVNQSYRALAVQNADGALVWFWIGDHASYDRLIK